MHIHRGALAELPLAEVNLPVATIVGPRRSELSTLFKPVSPETSGRFIRTASLHFPLLDGVWPLADVFDESKAQGERLDPHPR